MSFLGPSDSFSTLAPESSQSWSQPENSNPKDIRSLTVRQLLSAHRIRGTFCIGQQPLGKFTLVANVYRSQALLLKSRVLYGFDDGTGKISGYKTETTGTSSPTFAPFAYATILGQLTQDSDGSVVVDVQKIRALTDAHEIYSHTLQVIFEDLQYERARQQDWLSSQIHNHQIDGLVSRLRNTDISSQLPELEQDIISCIEHLKECWKAHDDTESLDRGIPIASLVHELSRDHWDKEAHDFWDAIESLLMNGLLRTTIDDNHLDIV